VVAALFVLDSTRPPMVHIRQSTPAALDHGVEVVTALAVLLCFLPQSSRYFREKKNEPDQ
jgi:hypothetical protein